jgi:hypothetical protein
MLIIFFHRLLFFHYFISIESKNFIKFLIIKNKNSFILENIPKKKYKPQ